MKQLYCEQRQLAPFKILREQPIYHLDYLETSDAYLRPTIQLHFKLHDYLYESKTADKL